MWEVFTEGRMPFEKNTNYEVVTMVTRGHRLYRPKLASKYVYEVMLRCWQEVYNFLCVLFKKVSKTLWICAYRVIVCSLYSLVRWYMFYMISNCR